MNQVKSENPRVTVITTVKNAVETISSTIESVTNQSYANVEYIVIDGESDDGTLDIIDKFRNRIDILLCERDDGVYYAMNKGAGIATGDWLVYMNAGDTFVNNNSLRDAVNLFDEKSELVYGDVYVCEHGAKKLIKADLEGRIFKLMPFCHQSLFVRTSTMKEIPFNTEYIVLADYFFVLTSYLKGKEFQYINMPVSYYMLGGFSYINRLLMYIEGVKILIYFERVHDEINHKSSVYYKGLQSLLCTSSFNSLENISLKLLMSAIYFKIKKRLTCLLGCD